MPKIQLTAPDGATYEFEVTAPSATIGRAPENDFVVPDGSVSSRHGKIHLKGESIEIEDLGSTNGTHVGGERVERADIVPGGAFRLGNVQGILVGEAIPAQEEAAEEQAPAYEAAAEESAPAGDESWSQTYNPNSPPVIAGLGATPCPTHQRQGFGPKVKEKNSGGAALMGVAALGLLVCAGAAFMIMNLSA